MDYLKECLNRECDRTLTSQEWDKLLMLGEELNLKKGEVLIRAGSIDPSVYIVKEGVMRGFDFNGEKERTFCFGLPGTIFNSRHSFYRNLPSCYEIEAACASKVIRIKREDYINLTDTDHRFAVWALHYAWWEQYLEEDRESTVHKGDTEERYVQMMKTRPLIVEKVSQRIIASYLGVTPEHLSRIKAKVLRTGKRD